MDLEGPLLHGVGAVDPVTRFADSFLTFDRRQT